MMYLVALVGSYLAVGLGSALLQDSWFLPRWRERLYLALTLAGLLGASGTLFVLTIRYCLS